MSGNGEGSSCLARGHLYPFRVRGHVLAKIEDVDIDQLRPIDKNQLIKRLGV